MGCFFLFLGGVSTQVHARREERDEHVDDERPTIREEMKRGGRGFKLEVDGGERVVSFLRGKDRLR
jgi:hypothetical protein